MTVGGGEGFVYDPRRRRNTRKAANGARVHPLRSKNYMAPKTVPTDRPESFFGAAKWSLNGMRIQRNERTFPRSKTTKFKSLHKLWTWTKFVWTHSLLATKILIKIWRMGPSSELGKQIGGERLVGKWSHNHKQWSSLTGPSTDMYRPYKVELMWLVSDSLSLSLPEIKGCLPESSWVILPLLMRNVGH